jgi:hypothetical protein
MKENVNLFESKKVRTAWNEQDMLDFGRPKSIQSKH